MSSKMTRRKHIRNLVLWWYAGPAVTAVSVVKRRTLVSDQNKDRSDGLCSVSSESNHGINCDEIVGNIGTMRMYNHTIIIRYTSLQ